MKMKDDFGLEQIRKNIEKQNKSLNRDVTIPNIYNNQINNRDNKRSFGTTLKHRIYDTQKGKCAKCSCKIGISHMEFHHKKSWSNGGWTESKNCIGLCHNCHKDIHDDERIKTIDKRRTSVPKKDEFSLW